MGLPTEQIPLLELFTSVQGEGKNLGVPYTFVRVGGCPLRCRFCDTAYSWEPNTSDITYVQMVINRAIGMCEVAGIEWVSITGGEPMLYPQQLKDMMLAFSKHGLKTHIETSGRYYDQDVHFMSHLWSMDIKTPCTNECHADDLLALVRMRKDDQVKCLIEGTNDLEYAKRVHKLLDGRCELVLQPFNVNVDNEHDTKSLVLMEQYAWLVNKVLDGSYKWTSTVVAPQVHVLAFGNSPNT